MTANIDVLRRTNQSFVDLMNGLSVEQLNAVPTGFNNNIVWNFAHSLAVQQGFFYGLSGLPYTIKNEFIDRYKKGTKPEGVVSKIELADIVKMFANAIDVFEKDYNNNSFKQYHVYTTSVGFTITNIDEAIQCASFHDGWHFGYARAIKKLALGV